MDQPKQIQVLKVLRKTVAKSERDKDVDRKREQRSEAARIVIPEVVDPHRRESSLQDPEKFLKTYFKDRYTIPFGSHHYAMIDSLISRAKHGGRQAVAAPRGCGKSECVKGMMVFLILAQLIRFPLIGAATTKAGKRLYQDFRTKISNNDLLYEDFPEVCHPVRALEGAPQRASKQHVNGVPTKIVWTSTDYLRLADIPGDANQYMQSKGWQCSPYGGVKMSYFGLDSAFRGFNIDGDRPDFVPIDDPETRESAKSYDQGVDREEIIDKDIAGLVSQEGNISIAVLTTVQNCYSLSYRLTDPKLKPSFNGLRYGMIETWPKNLAMWDDYIAMRHSDQVNGDEFGLSAVAYYLENREAMDDGVTMLSDHFVEIELEDGTQTVHSAIQQAFNKISDTNLEAYKTEYQNNPTEDDQDETLELTAKVVASRLSGYERNSIPSQANDDFVITMGLDLGDRYGHWVKTLWFGNSTGLIIDYGVMEVPGHTDGIKGEALELAMLRALIDFYPKVMEISPPAFCLIDSSDGDHTNAVYRAVDEMGGMPFAACKGLSSKRFRTPRVTDQNRDSVLVWDNMYANYQEKWDVWLYHPQVEYWKHLSQRYLVTPTFTEGGFEDGKRIFNDGSLSLFTPLRKKEHLTISQHIVSENKMRRFEPEKGWTEKWIEHTKNNHYLDALGYACAAAGAMGVELIAPEVKLVDAPLTPQTLTTVSGMTMPDGRPYSVLSR